MQVIDIISSYFSDVLTSFLKNPVTESVQLSTTRWREKQEITKGGVLSLSAVAYHGTIEWYRNGVPVDHSFLTGNITKVGDEIVRDEQRLTIENVLGNRTAIYQVLAIGFEGQQWRKTEVTTYGG